MAICRSGRRVGADPSAGQEARHYLLRGGFFMADNCHGTQEQAYFEKTMEMVFPDRELVDIPNNDPIFHTFPISTTGSRFRERSTWRQATRKTATSRMEGNI